MGEGGSEREEGGGRADVEGFEEKTAERIIMDSDGAKNGQNRAAETGWVSEGAETCICT